jgi:hypothetical protein
VAGVRPDNVSGAAASSPGRHDRRYDVLLALQVDGLGSVVCAADFDDSGLLNADDLFAFLDAWFAQIGQTGTTWSADFDDNDVVDVDDLFAFLDAWFAGCQ